MMALMLVDRDRKYFISTALTSQMTKNIYRHRWRMVDGVAKKITTSIDIPEVADAYFSAASKVYQHNRCRQDDLDIEKKFEVKEWSMRVNSTLLGLCAVDAWLLYKGARGARTKLDPDDFCTYIAEGLIDNKYDSIGLRRRRNDYEEEQTSSRSGNGLGPHLKKTKLTRMRKGKMTKHKKQGRCRICKDGSVSILVCSACEEKDGSQLYICDSSTSKGCLKARFAQHFKDTHYVDA